MGERLPPLTCRPDLCTENAPAYYLQIYAALSVFTRNAAQHCFSCLFLSALRQKLARLLCHLYYQVSVHLCKAFRLWHLSEIGQQHVQRCMPKGTQLILCVWCLWIERGAKSRRRTKAFKLKRCGMTSDLIDIRDGFEAQGFADDILALSLQPLQLQFVRLGNQLDCGIGVGDVGPSGIDELEAPKKGVVVRIMHHYVIISWFLQPTKTAFSRVVWGVVGRVRPGGRGGTCWT